ncbi:MAG: hypothetical protein COA49_09895 [Bacteroidetes bacterium]|nr:MAG: hypothetical protein COA49_09895 [Bacteroidota bacterium]
MKTKKSFNIISSLIFVWVLSFLSKETLFLEQQETLFEEEIRGGEESEGMILSFLFQEKNISGDGGKKSASHKMQFSSVAHTFRPNFISISLIHSIRAKFQVDLFLSNSVHELFLVYCTLKLPFTQVLR